MLFCVGDSDINNDHPSTQDEFVLELIITKVPHGTDGAGCTSTSISLNLLLRPEVRIHTNSDKNITIPAYSI